MKSSLITLLVLIALPVFVVGQTSSIYSIQYTTNPGNGTYPSPLEGQYVSTGGIVTAIDYNDKNYFISSSAGGAWNGIFVYDDDYSPAIGDSVLIQGEVYEYYGLTEIKNLAYLVVISSGNPLPPPVQVSTHTAATEEAYESVFVEVNDVEVSEGYNPWGDWLVNDESGDCIISYGFYHFMESNFPLYTGYPYSGIKGIVSYSYDEFRLHPRGISDLYSQQGAFILSAGQHYVSSPNEFSVPISLTIMNQPSSGSSFTLNMDYDPNIIEYSGFDQNATLSQNGTIQDQSSPGNVNLAFSGDFSFDGMETLIKLNFEPLTSGSSNLDIVSASLNSSPIEYLSSGAITITLGDIPIGDTLTVIQRPIQNIPAIVVPGDEMQIICLAPENTENWHVELVHNFNTVSLVVSSADYNNELQIWTLNAMIPPVDLYELYNLKVTASESIFDISKKAVQVLPEIKSNYYFAHITDTHLPTHYFYRDPESVYDTSEMQDFREVIKDINLIRPEFVLLTGDFVNEGELEDFENRRWHTKAQRILSELEVPVYLMSGNHDLGGWDETPPPQGTSRHEWWRFFGWKWLYNNANGNYTQDYSFDYGPVHFTGLEAYYNYDGFLYNIYGETSFINSQLQWLENDLLNASGSEARVVFYHYDFAEQIDLENLNIDMALWGHIHDNSGSIYTPPYNLSTSSVCDGKRAFRMINVNDGILQANETSYAGYTGENLSVSYFPSNQGLADSVIATIENQHDLDFQNGLVKFIMPKENPEYFVQNGELLQVDTSGNFAVCYVKVSIPANENIAVSIGANSISGIREKSNDPGITLFRNYPNPFKSETTIQFQLSKPEHIKIEIYDISGRLLKTFLNGNSEAGFHQLSWDGKNNQGNVPAGNVFYCRLISESGFSEVIRLVKL